MINAVDASVIVDRIGPNEGAARRLKQAAMVMLGIVALALAAKVKVDVWPSPVPVTLGTFAVLTIGAAYGARLGLVTMLGYLLIGALGYDVFAGSSAQVAGLEYMAGSTGGYLLGYVMAVLVLGQLAARGWDRSVVWMALALLIGNVVIYVPGLLWLGQLYGWDEPILAWGLTPFLIGDAMKLVLAALILPGAWALIGTARR